MQDDPTPQQNIVGLGLAVEGGLAIAAVALGQLAGQRPLATVTDESLTAAAHFAAITWGLAATIPMFAGLLAIERIHVGPLARLSEVVHQHVVPLLAGATLGELALVSLLAGIGEEMFFRGFLQSVIAARNGSPLGSWLGVAIASILFGICHLLTPTYGVLAAILGAYLGILYFWTGNLLAPITTHAVYDFGALVYLLRLNRSQ